MSNTRLILEGCIAQFKDINQLSNSESEIFELFCGTQITKSLNLSFDEIENSIVDGGMDGGIDLFLNLINDDIVNTLDEIEELRFNNSTVFKVFINQSKKENSFRESAVDKLVTSCPLIFELTEEEDKLLQRFNSLLTEKTLLFRELWRRTIIGGGKVIINYNYCCLADSVVINDAFDSKIKQLCKLTSEKVNGAVVEYRCLSSIELLELYQKQKVNRLQLPFKETPSAITYGQNEIGYVGGVKLNDFLAFIKDEEGNLREDLFESNIRHYQGEVDVNNKIRQTLEHDKARDFWWLNNGITIIASKPTQVAKTLSIENIQIVNGLQTSYSIGNFYQIDPLDERSVLIKVIINNDKETIDKIIGSTNSQNAVSPTLLRATETTQRNIEIYFLKEGYYYDRRKNFYKNQGKPVKRIFSIQFTAQAIQTILYNDPASARAKPTTLIKDRASYDRIFNPHVDFKSYLRCVQIVQKAFEGYSAIADRDIKSKLANFKLHFARVLASVVLSKSAYTAADLIAINIDAIKEEDFNKSIEILEDAINVYQANNQGAVITNIAKNKNFNQQLLSSVTSKIGE